MGIFSFKVTKVGIGNNKLHKDALIFSKDNFIAIVIITIHNC